MIIRVTSEDFCQGAFSGTIWTHERVDFTARHTESQSTNNLLIANGDMQFLYVQFLHKADSKYTPVRPICERRRYFDDCASVENGQSKIATHHTPWCNGNTAPFGGVILGSNPSGVAIPGPICRKGGQSNSLPKSRLNLWQRGEYGGLAAATGPRLWSAQSTFSITASASQRMALHVKSGGTVQRLFTKLWTKELGKQLISNSFH